MERRHRIAWLAGLAVSVPWLAACSSSSSGAGPVGPASVLQHHGNARRDGHYLAPTLTPSAAANLARDTGFAATVTGSVLAQPLYVASGPGGLPAVLVATEQNQVFALDAASGAVRWRVTLGASVPLSRLPCGNIDPLGVTGTPIVDAASRTIYLAAMTTPDGGTTKRHLVFALSLDDGSTRVGFPVGVEGRTDGVSTFDSSVQNQRGALALVGGRLYVPYGGHWGDCGAYHGWLVGIDLADPTKVTAWATAARGGGSWAPSGPSSDGASLFISTGNTFGASTWMGGEAVIRFSPGPTFSGSSADWFAPTNWMALDAGDVDLGGTGPVLLDLPGATPTTLAVALGKDGKLYVLDRTTLGGVGGHRSVTSVSSTEIINAAAAWVDAAGATVVFNGTGAGCPTGAGDLVAALIPASATPTAAVRWCAQQHGLGSPVVTTTNGSANPIVWSVGAEGDGRLRGFDGATGAVLFGGGGASELMGTVHRFQTPIVAGGRIYVAGDGAVYAFRW